ncbi:hypothetical protein [Neobacillus cucumis]|uniref:hypothetical protein n=1 Tax=Neobacillus cucumis TaxID=1740721 RepID=UPI00285304ED|nr:hypothetical protein [Neobacillus cucumis]MDR4949292.1 hypothetical protein [Neobacillus cucumis]
MEWLLYLLILLCPLVMIISNKSNNHQEGKVFPEEMEKKLKFLQEENNMLRDEVDFLSELIKYKSN